jgi:uncharacterized protein (TIGR04255 family)
VSLETSSYETWDAFRERLQAVVGAAAEYLDPAFEQRLGLRYIDRLAHDGVDQPTDWARYVVPELLGPVLHAGFGPAVRAAQQQIVLALDEGGTTQCGFRHGFVGEPGEPSAYVLDYDVYREETRPFSVEDTLSAVDDFNGYALQLFQASITSEYRETLA